MKTARSCVKIMGILNVTPDSFSDGEKFFVPHFSIALAARCAREIIRQGADIIDVGGEATGPGSKNISLKEELHRVVPVIKRLAVLPEVKRGKILISVDTYKAEVARQAILAGARIVNDVTALRGDTKMAQVIAKTGVQIILMYSKDSSPRTTRIRRQYRDVVKTVMEFLAKRIEFALRAGIKRRQIIIDPGMGAFVSSDPKCSFEILRRLAEFKQLGFPILVGTSMKSFLPGAVSQRDLSGRRGPTLISNLVAIQNGAAIIRVHDTAQHKRLCDALRNL